MDLFLFCFYFWCRFNYYILWPRGTSNANVG